MNYLSQRHKDAKKGAKVIGKVANLFFLFIAQITNAKDLYKQFSQYIVPGIKQVALLEV
jgi:hypothetical protein